MIWLYDNFIFFFPHYFFIEKKMLEIDNSPNFVVKGFSFFFGEILSLNFDYNISRLFI